MLFSKIIKKKFDAVLGRYDGNPAKFYYTQADFPDLKSEPFDVQGSQGLMKGWFYYSDKINPEKFIIFDHGIGAGHMAYLGEINCLASHGYTVYSYDHTGCVLSEGSGILGFSQGVNDLDRVISAIEAEPRFKNAKIRLIGHSWGGYSAMNVVALHPEVSHVVSLAGFLSARALVEQYLPKFVLKYSSEVMGRERELNPEYADLDARESLKKSNAKLLHLQSKDDVMVRYELCYTLLYAALKDREGTEFMSFDSRNHDPQRTDAAAAENRRMEQQLNALNRKKKLASPQAQEEFRKAFDWKLIYQQDPAVWEKIFEFLEK